MTFAFFVAALSPLLAPPPPPPPLSSLPPQPAAMTGTSAATTTAAATRVRCTTMGPPSRIVSPITPGGARRTNPVSRATRAAARLGGRGLRRVGLGRGLGLGAGLAGAHVEPEGRIAVGHQRRVGDDPPDPAV